MMVAASVALVIVAVGMHTGAATITGVTGGNSTAAASSSAASLTGSGDPRDPNVTYVGRWDTSTATAPVAQWTGAYLTTAFTGTTARLKIRKAVNLYASVDGGPDTFRSTSRGTINLTPKPLAAGTHVLRITYRSGDTAFLGLTLDSGARTVRPTMPAGLVETVGDSITAGYTDSKLALSAYGWVLGEKLGVRHTTIARAGYCLVARTGCVGQSDQYFRLNSTGTTAWDFSRYQANAVIINLGTNDAGHGVPAADFQSTYTTFLSRIRAKYPGAAIFAMETLKRRYVPQTKAAVGSRQASGDRNVYYVPTEGWLTTGVDYNDGDGHPNDTGQIKIANRLAGIVNPHLTATANGNSSGAATANAGGTVTPASTAAGSGTTATAPATGLSGAADPTATGTGRPADPNLRYFGRWDTSSSAFFASMWTGAYVKVGFTGTTVRLRQRGRIDLWASIDSGPDVAYSKVSGTVNLTPTPLRSGRHTLRVSYRAVAGSYHGDAGFGGVQLDARATTFVPATSERIIEFVGDSITVGQLTSKISLTAYPWLVSESLGAEHTQIAQGGACLVATTDGCVGLEKAFLRTGSTGSSPAWDFTRYQPDTVVINLGTNDIGHRVSSTQFQSHYTQFLRLVRAKYPKARLYALQTFRDRYTAQTRAAVDSVRAGGDTAVTFVATKGWITTADTFDKVHPNDEGHRKIAVKLAQLLSRNP